MDEQIKEQNITWIDEEQKLNTKNFDGERLPYLKFEAGKLTEFEVDFSKKFETYHTTDSKGKPITKAIIPVTHDKVKKVWFLNKNNPIYREILAQGKLGNNKIAIIQIGSLADTKYQLVKK
jgi:hypothetical protein